MMNKKDRINSCKKSMLNVVVLIVCIVGLSFSWFRLKEYIGHSFYYQKDMMIASSSGEVTNYLGIDQGNNKIKYTKIEKNMKVTWIQDKESLTIDDNQSDSSFVVKNLFPGQRIYFKTEISNNKEKNISFSLYLSGIEYSAELNSAIRFVQTQPSSLSKCYENEAVQVEKNRELVCKLPSARISNNMTIKGNSKNEIYWYIEIIGDKAGNECQDKWLTINQMQLLKGSK